MKELTLYGGSFDPVHVGHEFIITYCLSKFNGKLLVIPTKNHPFKNKKLTPFQYRHEMLVGMKKQIFSNNSQLEISVIENEANVNNSYELVNLYRIAYPENLYKINFVIGQDCWEDRHLWKDFDKLAKMVRFIIFKRSDDYIAVPGMYDALVVPLRMPVISSTEIRELIRNNNYDEAGLYLSNFVLDFIKQNDLYLEE